MRIRVIIPVTNLALKPTAQAVYTENAAPDVQISVAAIEQGPTSIESIYEDSLAGPQVVAQAIQAQRDGMDAVVIDCMNDPGLEAAREAVSIPVVGAAQASMLLAALLAHRFSVLGTAARDVYPIERLVRRYGLGEKYASTRSVETPVLDLHANPDRLLAVLVEESAAAIQQDGAHAIVFGCTGMRGMASQVRQQLIRRGMDAPVIEPSLAALKWAEMLAGLKLAPSRRTYPAVEDRLLPEHRSPVPGRYEESNGRLHSQPDLHVLVPVTQGYRPDDWLEEGRQAYLRYARPGTKLTVTAIAAGPQTIETQYDRAMAVPGMLRLTRKAEQEGAGAVMIDCMSDPGIDPMRELASIPVIGPCQTSAFIAASLGHRFSILATRADMAHKFVSQVEDYGLSSRLASSRSIGMSVQEVESDPDRVTDALAQAAEMAVVKDGAHVIIPGCTGMIGLAEKLQSMLARKGIDVPVIEPPGAAVKMAEALCDLGLSHSKLTYPLPP